PVAVLERVPRDGDVRVPGGGRGGQEDAGVEVGAAEAVVPDQGVAQPLVGVDAVTVGRADFVVVPDQVLLDDGRVDPVAVQVQADDVVLNDVVPDRIPGERRRGLDAGPERGAGGRALDGEPVQDDVVGRQAETAARAVDVRLGDGAA